MCVVTLAGKLFFVLIILSTCTYVNGQPGVDLELTAQAPSHTLHAGESFSYTATIRNIGTAPATNVRLGNAPPQNVEITSVSTSQGFCPASAVRGGGILCTIGDIEPNGMVSLSFTVNVVHLEDLPDSATGLPRYVPGPARAPYPPDGDWSFEVATISADVVGADPNRSNNVARVKIDLEPRSNGLPLVRILFPTANSEITRQGGITVKIQAYDTDGAIDRVVVREPKYIPLPFVENGVYKFIYLGKRYTAAELTRYVKATPPPLQLARRTGRDSFEYTIIDRQRGPNQFDVEVFDKQGRTNSTFIIFIVR
jgi:uncharacterized repeat protein (TIGR01451 family)